MSTPLPPPPPQQLPPAGRPGSLPPSDERTWALAAHLSPFIGWFFSLGSLTFLGPLVIWAVFKDRSPFVRNAAAGSFNVNVTLLLVNVAALVFAVFTLGLGLLVALPVWIATFVLAVVLHALASVKAARGESFRYPLQVPILH